MKTIRCPPGLNAFAGFPSEDCPSEAHFYKCVKGIAVVSKCNSTSRYILSSAFPYQCLYSSYDPVLSDCAPFKGTAGSQRKIADDRSSANYLIDVDAMGREVHLGNFLNLNRNKLDSLFHAYHWENLQAYVHTIGVGCRSGKGLMEVR